MPVMIQDFEITSAPPTHTATAQQAPASQAGESAPAKLTAPDLQKAEVERRERALRVFAH